MNLKVKTTWLAAAISLQGLAAYGVQAESSVTVSENLTIDIPVLLYMGNQYSAKMNYNGSCWVAAEVVPIANSTPQYKTATVTHSGFDFSTGEVGPEWEQQDFYLTAWANTNYPTGYEWGSGIWVNTYDYSQIHVMDQGEVELSSVTEIPTDWSVPVGAVDYPLQLNHVYILRARDGFAKFKVVSLSPSGTVGENQIGEMQIEIEYEYTEGTSF